MDTSIPESESENLYRVTMQGKWEVVKIYEKNPKAHKMRITHEGGTALHLAVIECREETVLKLVQEISKIDKGALEIQNDIGYTPLHHAASAGSKTMCKYIVEAADPSLIGVRTINTETALFIATVNGKKEAFFYLHSVCSATSVSSLPDHHLYSYTRRSKDGVNILHIAISKEHFDLAYQIIHLYEDLVNSVNEMGLTPFHYLAMSSAFKSCSYNLGLWKRLIYRCIVVKELKADLISNLHSEDRKNVDQNCMKIIYHYF
nr:NF-kappa-B inhibitor cactus-like isoform X2 [Ziziphus jujuba var. spinosa]